MTTQIVPVDGSIGRTSPEPSPDPADVAPPADLRPTSVLTPSAAGVARTFSRQPTALDGPQSAPANVGRKWRAGKMLVQASTPGAEGRKREKRRSEATRAANRSLRKQFGQSKNMQGARSTLSLLLRYNGTVWHRLWIRLILCALISLGAAFSAVHYTFPSDVRATARPGPAA